MNPLYPDCPPGMRITDFERGHGGGAGNITEGEQRKGCFAWTRELLEAASGAREDDASWETIRQELIATTGKEINIEAVARRITRFQEEDR